MATETLLLSGISPFPFYDGDKNSDGIKYKGATFCKKCEAKECYAGKKPYGVPLACSFGFSFVRVNFLSKEYVINGILANDNLAITGKRRRELKGHVVENQALNDFTKNLSIIERGMIDAISAKGIENISYIHDVRTSVNVVLAFCEDIVAQAPGQSFSEKIDNASHLLKGLYQSINLLTEHLDLADIIINPSAITYGPKSSSSLYGFLYKMVKLFEPLASRIQNRIQLNGHSDAKINTYNSFQFIPLILLDNAIKYSAKHRDIYVNIQEFDDGVAVRISSYGEIVPAIHKEKIFEKYFRGPNALKRQSHGMGLGLWLARLITDAHGFSLTYESNLSEEGNGNNDFVLFIPHKAIV